MSDWEDAIDDVLEGKDTKETKKFEEEDDVDSEEEDKKKKAAAKAEQEAQRSKNIKNKPKTIDEKWEEKQKKKAGGEVAITSKMSKGQKQEAIATNAEQALVDELFAPEIGMDAGGLNSKENYVAFAKQVSDILYEGQANWHVPVFYTELCRGLSSSDPEDIKKVVDCVTLIYNKKLAEKKGGGKKADNKKGKAKLAAGKATDNSRNNNPAMIADLMGDDYGDEEDTSGAKRIADDVDPNDDFM